MASSLQLGQQLQGKLGSYSLSKKIHRYVWLAVGRKLDKVIVKTASPLYRLDNEREFLKQFRHHPRIWPLVDEITEPPCLVLRYLDDDALHVSTSKRLAKSDIKFIARNILEVLSEIHEAGYVHTDVKPDNILLGLNTAGTHELSLENGASSFFRSGESRFKEVQLGDCGDVYRIPAEVNPYEDGHVIGAAIFRSPEAQLNLRWGTPTDIWSLGATLISLIWGEGFHIFNPSKEFPPDHENYAVQVLIKQVSYFGPWPKSYTELVDPEKVGPDRIQFCTIIQNHINDNDLRKPFHLLEDPDIDRKDKAFIGKMMKLDPSERASAKELLNEDWLKEE